MSSNYAELTRDQAIEKLKEVELNADLTGSQKIDEFDKVAYGQVFDIIGASVCLVLGDEIVCQPVNYNPFKHHQHRFSILYTPTDETLPTVVLSYDNGLLTDLIKIDDY